MVCMLRLATSLKYLTKSFAVSDVTMIPRSASCVIVLLLASMLLSIVMSRQRLSLKNAILVFSVSVSIFTNRSTGIIGCGQAMLFTISPFFVISVILIPASLASHFPHFNTSGASVKAVLLLSICFKSCAFLVIHAFKRLSNSLSLFTSLAFFRTCSIYFCLSIKSEVLNMSINMASSNSLVFDMPLM